MKSLTLARRLAPLVSSTVSSTIAHPNRGLVSLAALYFFSSASAFLWTYMPRYFETLGWSGAAVGIFFTLKTIGQTVATPLWAQWSDRTRAGHRLVQLQFGLSVAAVAALPLMKGPVMLVAIALVLGITLRCSAPLMDALTMDEAGLERYGQVRAWGTIGLGLVALGAMVLGFRTSHAQIAAFAPPLMLMLMLASTLVTAAIPASRPAAPGAAEQPVTMRSALLLLRRPHIALLFGLSALFVATHAPYAMSLVSLAEARHFGAWLPGLAVATGILGELLAFAMAHRLLRRFRAIHILVLSVGVTAVRWYFTGTTESPVVFIALQVLHGLSFALFFMVLVNVLMGEVAARMRATGQSLMYLIVFSIGGGLGTFVFGLLSEVLSPGALFRWAGYIDLALVGLFALYARRYGQRVCRKPRLINAFTVRHRLVDAYHKWTRVFSPLCAQPATPSCDATIPEPACPRPGRIATRRLLDAASPIQALKSPPRRRCPPTRRWCA